MFNIARNTFREIIRNRFFSLIAFLGAVFILLSLTLDTLALGEVRRVLFDFGLSFIEITGLIILLFLGGGMISREIEGRTIYLMLSKPIRRGSIIVGKFFGFSGILFLVVGIESLLLLLLIMFKGFSVDYVFFLAIIGIFLKLEALLALILFFSTWTSPIMSMFLTVSSYIIGHSGYAVLDYSFHSQNVFGYGFGRFLLAIFPNLESLNLKNYVATDASVSISLSLLAFLLVLMYMMVILYLSVYIFERKSFDTV